MKLILTAAMLAFSVTAQAEFFPVSIQAKAQYDCPTETYLDCRLETINVGNVNIDLLNGAGKWSETYTFSGVEFNFQVDVLKLNFPSVYRIFITAKTSFGGASEESHAVIEVSEPALFPLSGTYTSFVPTGATFANGTVEVQLAH